MVIKLKEIKMMMDRLVRVWEKGNPEITIDKDFYLYFDDRYKFSGSNDENILMGSLNDDMESLQELIHDEEFYPSNMEWEKLGNLLITISEELGK